VKNAARERIVALLQWACVACHMLDWSLNAELSSSAWLWAAALFVGLFLVRCIFAQGAQKVSREESSHRSVARGDEDSYSDPLRWAFLGKGARGPFLGNSTEPEASENDCCITKVIAMHRPTMQPWREATADYPYAWHLSGRKRLFEIRLQLRLKQIPKGKLHFGLTLGGYVHVGGAARQVQKALLAACRSIVGDLYHSSGDDPATCKGEVEPPTFVIPLWAFDQIVVSDPGDEPSLAGDLSTVGHRRTDGIAAYARKMRDVIDNISTDKVYTFCFWGVSQYLDCMRWEVCGVLPGLRIDFNKLCGAPPVYVAMYELPGVTEKEAEESAEKSEHKQKKADKDADKRHLPSRKRYYFNVAMWSEHKPPPSDIEGIPRLVDTKRTIAKKGKKIHPTERSGCLRVLHRTRCSRWIRVGRTIQGSGGQFFRL